MFTVRDAVQQHRERRRSSCCPTASISRTGTPQVAGYYILFEGLIGYLDGALQEVKYAALSPGQPDDYPSTGGWLGFTDKYWLTALIPAQNEPIKARFTHSLRKRDRPLPDRLFWGRRSPSPRMARAPRRPAFSPAPRKSTCSTLCRLGIPLFDRAIDFGWFYFLTKPIFLILAVLRPTARQFRPGDPAADLVRQAAVLSRSPTNPTRR